MQAVGEAYSSIGIFVLLRWSRQQRHKLIYAGKYSLQALDDTDTKYSTI